MNNSLTKKKKKKKKKVHENDKIILPAIYLIDHSIWLPFYQFETIELTVNTLLRWTLTDLILFVHNKPIPF